MLFQELDVNHDGQLDEQEFEMLFNMQSKDKPGKLQDNVMIQENLNEEEVGNYMTGGYNTYNKRPL